MKTYLTLFYLSFFLIVSCKTRPAIQPVFNIAPNKYFVIKSPTVAYNDHSGRYDIYFTVSNKSAHKLQNESIKFDFYSFNNVGSASVNENISLNIDPGKSKKIDYFIYFANTERPEKIFISY